MIIAVIKIFFGQFFCPGSAPERKVSVLSELRSVSAREGDGATFECTVSEVETAGSWELGGRPLRPGGRVRIRTRNSDRLSAVFVTHACARREDADGEEFACG